MAEYPRVEPQGDITCGPGCEVVFYKAPGPVRPYVIGCQNRKCGNKGFVRSDSAADTEAAWLSHLKKVEA